MPSFATTSYGLDRLTTGSGHAVVVLHGIRQTRDAVVPFARTIADASDALDVFVYGYNHTRGLERNGRDLASAITDGIPTGRVDVVGYSMGGLVARLAAMEGPRIHTVITLATPNRGSLSNAELTTLGQLGRSVFEIISPIAPGMEGVKDLTRAAKIMSARRDAVLQANPGLIINATGRRYASIPGLFYNKDQANFAWGPSVQITGLTASLALLGLRIRLMKMERPHDGIVTERSNNISTAETHDWSEVHLVDPGPNGEPARCHAVIDCCRKHDHISILRDAAIAQFTAALLTCDDWRILRQVHSTLRHRVRLYPFACDST
jgi:pimeloyl-ACP methyl ester carboxylesterase